MIKVYQLTMPQNNFIATIPFKGCHVSAVFKNGNVAKNINAKLVTNDPFIQRALEASNMFGKMFTLVETHKEPEDDVVSAAPAPQAKKPAAKGGGKKSEPKTETEQTDTGNAGDSKEFNGVAEAIVYIASTYGAEVHTKGEAIAYLAEQGIQAVINE